MTEQHQIGNPAVAESSTGSTKPSSVIDYTPLPMERLIGMADLSLIGTVEAITDERLRIRIDESLQQQLPSTESIVIKRVKRSIIFAPRQVPYMPGQQFMFFLLQADKSTDSQEWSILGYPIAGELPIEEGFVYFDSYDIDGFDFQEYEVHGVIRPMQRFDLVNFMDAIRKYRNCFSWSQVERMKNKRLIKRWVPVRVCDEKMLQNYRDRSQIHAYLARETVKQVPPKATYDNSLESE